MNENRETPMNQAKPPKYSRSDKIIHLGWISALLLFVGILLLMECITYYRNSLLVNEDEWDRTLWTAADIQTRQDFRFLAADFVASEVRERGMTYDQIVEFLGEPDYVIDGPDGRLLTWICTSFTKGKPRVLRVQIANGKLHSVRLESS